VELRIPIVDYVSPTVWVWRRWRRDGLPPTTPAILPFEPEVPSPCVDHLCRPPAIEKIDCGPLLASACRRCGRAADFLVLPGSRHGEISRLDDSGTTPFPRRARMIDGARPRAAEEIRREPRPAGAAEIVEARRRLPRSAGALASPPQHGDARTGVGGVPMVVATARSGRQGLASSSCGLHPSSCLTSSPGRGHPRVPRPETTPPDLTSRFPQIRPDAAC
jgi:lipid-A-disaccharide synthase